MALRDYLNFPIREELREWLFAHGQAIAILGVESLADQPQETWYFDENSMAEDNGTTVLKPNELLETDPGRYHLNMVQADWNAMFNKPEFATVAMTGSYNDLEDKITAGTGIVMDGNEMSMDNAIQADIDSKIPATRTITINGQTKDLSANRDWEVGNVSTDGSYANPSWITSLAYTKLTGAPSIPTNTNQLTNGAGYITSVPAQSFSSLTGKPTTLAGYGISDAYPLSGNPSNFLTGITSGQVTTALGLTPINTAGARTAISLTTTGTGAASYNSSTGVLNVPTPAAPIKEYVGNSTVTSAGNAIFYLTSDGTSTGTALFTTVTYANPFVNDSTVNYSYSWSYNATTKALTVNTKSAVGINVAVLSLTLLGTPANVANGTAVSVLVKGT